MNTNTMELNLNEMEQVNGGSDTNSKHATIKTSAGIGSACGVVVGGAIGSVVPVIGTVVGGTIGAAAGGIIGTGIAAIRIFFFDD